jgi:hypothetical protein
MTDRPVPHLLDLLRDSDDDLTPLMLRIVDAALDEERTPGDLQLAMISTTAYLVVHLTRPPMLRRRAREAEGLLRKFIRAHEKRVAELKVDLVAQQREMKTDLKKAFNDAFRHVLETHPLPQTFIDAAGANGQNAAFYRKTLLANELARGIGDAFDKAFSDHSPDRVTITLATVCAAAVVCAAPYDTNQHDEEGFADLLVDEFRGTLLRTIAYWRERKGN